VSQGVDPFAPVLAALAADPDTEFGAAGAEVQVLNRLEGLYSSVLRVRILTPARAVNAYLKVVKPRGPGQEGLAERFLLREYRATAAFYDAAKQDEGIGAVRPIKLLPEHRAMVTEEVPGRPLGEILAEATTLTDELWRIATRVGAWIRVYQSLGDGRECVELPERRAYLEHRLNLLEGRVLSGARRRGALEQFDALARELGTASLPAVPIHGDLGPMNIIVDERGRVTVLDFTMAKTGTTYHDLSHVYFHLELMAARHPARAPLFRALQQAMLAGYAAGTSAGHPLFRMMLLQHGVCHVALLAERRVPLLDPVYRWFLRRRWSICERLPLRREPARV
jgi:hypothetical protein